MFAFELNHIALFALCLFATAASAIPTVQAREMDSGFRLRLPFSFGSGMTTGLDSGLASAESKPSAALFPSFVFPTNFGSLKTGESFTIKMKLNNLEKTTYMSTHESEPGHSHIVIQELSSFDQTEPLDPAKFAFFKGLGLSTPTADGHHAAHVPGGLPKGSYRLSLINFGGAVDARPTPVVPHRSLGDVVYFSVKD